MKTLFNQIISTSLLIIAFLCVNMDAIAQNSPNRDISLKVLNKKGRPVEKIVVQSIKTGKAGLTDRSGLFVFAAMSDDDTISVRLPKYGDTRIPVTGMDSIVIKVRSTAQYSVNKTDGQSVIINKNTLEMNTILNVPEMLKKRSYSSLSQLLQGYISNRGVSSISSSTQPLVVLDGRAMGTLSEANNMINVYDIKTIVIQKDGFEWGARGANGVIIVKTR